MKKVLIRCLLMVPGRDLVLRRCSASLLPAPAGCRQSCVRVQDGAFHSAALDREMKYRILLPCGYQTGSGRFPVLYLLHGLYGDYLNWDTRTNLERYAQRYELIVVMPDAGDSWYTNSATDPKDKFEDYIAKDLVAEIDGKFRTLRSRHARAIAGLSMGGYGALKIALRYHDDFAFAGSLSGALNAPQDLGDKKPEFRDQLLKVFGPPGSAVRADNNVFSLLQSASAERSSLLLSGMWKCGRLSAGQSRFHGTAFVSWRSLRVSRDGWRARMGLLGPRQCRICCGQSLASYRVTVEGISE